MLFFEVVDILWKLLALISKNMQQGVPAQDFRNTHLCKSVFLKNPNIGLSTQRHRCEKIAPSTATNSLMGVSTKNIMNSSTREKNPRDFKYY